MENCVKCYFVFIPIKPYLKRETDIIENTLQSKLQNVYESLKTKDSDSVRLEIQKLQIELLSLFEEKNY